MIRRTLAGIAVAFLGAALIGFGAGYVAGIHGAGGGTCRAAVEWLTSTGSFVPGDPANDTYRQNVITCLGRDSNP